jgi:hypothetical protein
MSRYFAQVTDGIVSRVVVCDDPAWLTSRLGGTWVETADPYTEPGTVAYCGPGWGHDPEWPLAFAPTWQPWDGTFDEDNRTPFQVGSVVWDDGYLWVSTTPDNVSKPGGSGWRRQPVRPGEVPLWLQPTGGHDAYRLVNGTAEQVSYGGDVWETLIDYNDTVPGSDPRWWRKVTDEPEPDLPDWKPWDGHPSSLHQVGAEVAHNGHRWKATVGNNHWEPGVYGWADLGPV